MTRFLLHRAGRQLLRAASAPAPPAPASRRGCSSACEAASRLERRLAAADPGAAPLLAAARAAAAAELARLRRRLGLPPPPFTLRLAVALSGGVDSAVAAALVAPLPHTALYPVFAATWDGGDEDGGGEGAGCAAQGEERARAAATAVLLGLQPLQTASLVASYWVSVWQPFVDELAGGVATPNPDLGCNAALKFGALLDWATSTGAPARPHAAGRGAAGPGAHALATGHYARTADAAAPGRGGGGGCGCAQQPASAAPRARLLRGADPLKDQSYFLATVAPAALARAAFPVGGLAKAQVRRLAAALGLPPAAARSSTGICFVGKRRGGFGAFMEQYLVPQPGRLLDVDAAAGAAGELGGGAGGAAAAAAVVGLHRGRHGLTPGQRARVAGAGGAAFFVAGKGAAPGPGDVWVARGTDHPALMARTLAAGRLAWGAGAEAGAGGGGGGGGGGAGPKPPPSPLARLRSAAGLACAVRLRSTMQPEAATAWLAPWGDGGDGGGDWVPDPLCAPAAWSLPAPCPSSSSSSADPALPAPPAPPPLLRVRVAGAPLRGVSPGQAVVLYDEGGAEVLAAGDVAYSGPSERTRAARGGGGRAGGGT